MLKVFCEGWGVWRGGVRGFRVGRDKGMRRGVGVEGLKVLIVLSYEGWVRRIGRFVRFERAVNKHTSVSPSSRPNPKHASPSSPFYTLSFPLSLFAPHYLVLPRSKIGKTNCRIILQIWVAMEEQGNQKTNASCSGTGLRMNGGWYRI